MKEQYLRYITGKRTKNETILQQLRTEGFIFNRETLIQLAANDLDVRDALYNRTIKIYLSADGLFGHVFIEGPYFNVDNGTFDVRRLGKYGKPSFFSGKSGLDDDGDRGKEITKVLSTQLSITEEAWSYLGRFMHHKQTELAINNDYHFLLRNCADFADKALKTIGIVDGLIDKFDIRTFAELKTNTLKVVKPFMLNYFRVSKAAQFTSFIEDLLITYDNTFSTGFPIDIYAQLIMLSDRFPQYEEDRKQANLQTHINFVDSFIEGECFYNKYNTPIPSQAQIREEHSTEAPFSSAYSTPAPTSQLPLNPMEQSALEGLKLAEELQAQQAMLFGFPLFGMPSEEQMEQQARELIASSNAALAEVDTMLSAFKFNS